MCSHVAMSASFGGLGFLFSPIKVDVPPVMGLFQAIRRSASGQHTLAGSLGRNHISIHLEPVLPLALRGRLPAARTSRSEFSAEACFQCRLLCSCWVAARGCQGSEDQLPFIAGILI